LCLRRVGYPGAVLGMEYWYRETLGDRLNQARAASKTLELSSKVEKT
jgi:hypothetical protein